MRPMSDVRIPKTRSEKRPWGNGIESLDGRNVIESAWTNESLPINEHLIRSANGINQRRAARSPDSGFGSGGAQSSETRAGRCSV